MTPLHYFDSAIQLARNSARELTEEEFEIGMNAATQIEKRLGSYYLHLNLLSFVSEMKLERLPPGNVGTGFNDSSCGRLLMKSRIHQSYVETIFCIAIIAQSICLNNSR